MAKKRKEKKKPQRKVPRRKVSKPKPKPRRRAMPAPKADDGAPPWLQTMRAITGLTEWEDGSNPKIEGMAAYIGKTFPAQASYASQYTDDSIAWCGVTAAFCMATCDISGPFGPTDTDKWMWALSWADDPDYVHIGSPVLGCWVAMEREGGGHITCFEGWDGGMLRCRGGNQSDQVNVQSYDPDTVVAYVWPRGVPVPPPPPAERRDLEEGDEGQDVVELQTLLGLPPDACDGDFGPATDEHVKGFQAACGITVDGEVGPKTWAEVDDFTARHEARLPEDFQDRIVHLAKGSEIARYSFDDRGRMPPGYAPGLALVFALALTWLQDGDSVAEEMAKPNTGDDDEDVLSWYDSELLAAGIDVNAGGAESLRGLFTIMIALGPRESSGNCYEGRDMSADNVESDTCEASLFQTSWNISSASREIPPLLNTFWQNPSGFLETFYEDLNPSASQLDCYGSGDGVRYQWLSRVCPAFHSFVTGVGLRTRRNHWGPINREELDEGSFVPANEMLKVVQALVEAGVEPAPEPPPEPSENRVDIVANSPVEITVTGDVDVTLNGQPWEG